MSSSGYAVDTAESVGLTVGQAASRLGLTRRTLHHWDEIGLVSPSLRSHGGYRLYVATDIVRLQRALVYRELGIPLDTIRELLDARTADPTEPLRAQQEQIRERITRLHQMSEGLDRMIRVYEHGTLLTAEQQAAIFGPEWRPEWTYGARERWGDTQQWAEYAERAAGYDMADWEAIARARSELEDDLARAIRDGVAPGSAEANALAERHREAFGAAFHVTHEMHVCLGRMFSDDADFAAYLDRIHPGLSGWLASVIDANARAHGVDPETATWR